MTHHHHNAHMGQVLTTATDDPGGAGAYPDADNTQTQQATQQATQNDDDDANGASAGQDSEEQGRARRCWGFLQPCSRTMNRADFEKVHPTYSIGRGSDCHIRLRGNKVSNAHCLIKWDGRDERDAVVTVTDTSSNGTFINGERIGRGNSRILRDGNEIAFGTPQPGPPEDDYRFIYRQITGGPAQGLWAEYDMGSELGKGSFATVFGALHRKTGTWHAVKIIQLSKIKPGPGAQVDANGKVKNPFQREISVMENLRHRNICRMKEVFIEPDTLDIVLELVKGGDLLDRILKRGGLPEDETKDIVYQMCDALAYVHSQGIAHRDLKPENILLTDDEPPIVKVADFGLAKIADSMTMLRTMCGTPSYLAPEVVDQKNNEGYDHQVDSWSVGVIVFSMLTNTAPFIEDERIADLKLRILHRTIDWDTLYAMNLSHDCVDFVERLLERDVRKRMTLKDSLSHQWLNGYIPIYQRRELARGGSRGSLAGSSTSTLHRIVRADSSMSVDGQPPLSQASSAPFTSSHPPHIPGAYPPSLGTDSRHTPGGGVASPGNKSLLRRAHVLAQAAEEGSQLFEPPPEMVKEEEDRRRDAENAPPRQVAPAASRTRASKRKAPAQDHYAQGAGPAVVVADAVMAEPSEPAPNKRVRGRGRAPLVGGGMITRKRGSQTTPEEVDDMHSSQGGPRRSTRKRP